MTSERESAIVRLLEQYPDLADPVRAGDGWGTGGMMLMPHEKTCGLYRDLRHGPAHCTCSRRSVVELERLMVTMRDIRPSQWWHVNERYIRCERVGRVGLMLRGRWVNLEPYEQVVALPQGWTLELARQQSRRKTPIELPVTIARYSPQVRLEKVRRGVEWLAVNWAGETGPELPVIRDEVAA